MNELSRFLQRAEALVARLEVLLPAVQPPVDWGASIAFRWRKAGGHGHLQPVVHPHKIRLSDLRGIDRQKHLIEQNTRQFVSGLPANNVLTQTPAGTIMDHQPIVNVPPFGMCSSLANPTVAAATAAALGALTPMPCLPVTPAPWVVGSPTVLIGNMPALNNSSKLMCSWGGVIQISTPGQFTVQEP